MDKHPLGLAFCLYSSDDDYPYLFVGQQNEKSESGLRDRELISHGFPKLRLKTKNGIKYSAALSMTDNKDPDFIHSQTGIMSDKKNIAFAIPIDGRIYNATVHLEKK